MRIVEIHHDDPACIECKRDNYSPIPPERHSFWDWSPFQTESDPGGAGAKVWDDVFSRYNSGQNLYSADGKNGEPGKAGNNGVSHCVDETITLDEVRRKGCEYAQKVRGFLKQSPYPWDVTGDD